MNYFWKIQGPYLDNSFFFERAASILKQRIVELFLISDVYKRIDRVWVIASYTGTQFKKLKSIIFKSAVLYFLNLRPIEYKVDHRPCYGDRSPRVPPINRALSGVCNTIRVHARFRFLFSHH